MNATKHAGELHSARDARLRIDRRHFNVIFIFAFSVYLAAYGFARLLPSSWASSLCGIEPNVGIVEQARVQANLIASCATMI